MTAKKTKHAGGRPTKYGPDVVEKARAYIERYSEQGDVVPSVVGLCAYIGRAKSTVYDWCGQEDKKEFSDIVRAIEETQERKLLDGGLDKSFNPIIAKLLLSKHGYTDKQEIDHTTGGEKIEPTRIIFERSSDA